MRSFMNAKTNGNVANDRQDRMGVAGMIKLRRITLACRLHLQAFQTRIHCVYTAGCSRWQSADQGAVQAVESRVATVPGPRRWRPPVHPSGMFASALIA